jgi:hypothetical protein
MRRPALSFTKIRLARLLAFAAYPASYALAQEIDNQQPRLIENVRMGECINHLGQNIIRDGAAMVPFTINSKFPVSLLSTSKPRLSTIQSPLLTIGLIAQNFIRNSTIRVPLVFRVTQTR